MGVDGIGVLAAASVAIELRNFVLKERNRGGGGRSFSWHNIHDWTSGVSFFCSFRADERLKSASGISVAAFALRSMMLFVLVLFLATMSHTSETPIDAGEQRPQLMLRKTEAPIDSWGGN